MKKSEKIIWTTALILSAVSLYINTQDIPQKKLPSLPKGEFFCPAHIQEQANKLKPKIDIKQTIEDYKNKIKNASSYSEAWLFEEEIKNIIEKYNTQSNEYNLFLQKNCQQ